MMHRPWLAIPVFALVHFLSTIVLTVMTFSSTMSRFDANTRPTPLEAILDTVVSILLFPLYHLFLAPQSSIRILGSFSTLFVLLNSVLWGIVLYYGVHLIRRMYGRMRGRHLMP